MSCGLKVDLDSLVVNVPDFPKPGIQFKDISEILKTPVAFNYCIEQLALQIKDLNPTAIVAIESRGIIFASPLAIKLNLPLVLARKPNKLPREKLSASYELEYGSSTLEMHKGSLSENDRVVIIDDLLATGGTIKAAINLVQQQKAKVIASCFIIELVEFKAKDSIDSAVYSLLKY